MYEEEELKQKEQEKEFKRKHQRELDDLKWILSDPRGRRFVWKLIKYTCHVFDGYFSGSSRDIHEHAKQFVGKIVLRDIMDATGFKALDQMYREDEAEKKMEVN